MVEVPAAALMADQLAKEVDFFSIGTNDLIQYTLAVDRTNETVADLYCAADPAVLRLIAMVVDAARKHGIEVSVCGTMGGEPLYTMLLLGLGMRQLSMPPHQLPEIKRVIRGIRLEDARALAAEALGLADGAGGGRAARGGAAPGLARTDRRSLRTPADRRRPAHRPRRGAARPVADDGRPGPDRDRASDTYRSDSTCDSSRPRSEPTTSRHRHPATGPTIRCPAPRASPSGRRRPARRRLDSGPSGWRDGLRPSAASAPIPRDRSRAARSTAGYDNSHQGATPIRQARRSPPGQPSRPHALPGADAPPRAGADGRRPRASTPGPR